LEEIAKKEGKSLSGVIRDIVEKFLSREEAA